MSILGNEVDSLPSLRDQFQSRKVGLTSIHEVNNVSKETRCSIFSQMMVDADLKYMGRQG